MAHCEAVFAHSSWWHLHGSMEKISRQMEREMETTNAYIISSQEPQSEIISYQQGIWD